MPQTERKGGPVTFGQALGAKDENADLILNTFEQATCHTCGAEPRLYTHETEKGRTVVLWIAATHTCRVTR